MMLMRERFARYLWIVGLAVAFTACGDDNKKTTELTPFEALVEAGLTYVNSSDCPGVISAETLYTDGVENYAIFDLRSAETYAAGHIPGAINASVKTILADVEAAGLTKDAPIVVACYSGQSAGFAKIALELMGYTNVKTLGYGMSSWRSEYSGSWANAVGNALTAPETTNNNGSLTTKYDYPTFTGDVETLMAERVQAVLDDGFKGISYSDLVSNGVDNYFIINYFGEADYLGTGEAGVPGHIPGAYQFTPAASLGLDQMLPYLPTDMPIVVYCWTSQTSSQIAAWLRILGYEAYSLKNGANALFHDALTSHKWTDASTHDYPIELGATPTADFEAVADAASEYINDSSRCPGVINADDVFNNGVENYAIFDLRSATDFAAGHIDGAHNTALGTLLDDVAAVAAKDDAIVVACYTGQTASYAKFALEMAGYTNVKSLLYGMAAWNTALAPKWGDSVGDPLTEPETDGNNDSLVAHAFPALEGTLEERLDTVLADGFKAISYADMVSNGIENYFVINYFGEADYNGTGEAGVPGHIPGAFQFTPYASMGLDEMLMYIPTDMPVVVYCWTGQHSAQVTAYLRLLGYDAYSMKFGSNGLFHSSLTGHAWGESAENDYPLVTE
ncbi:MAG: hypothetical protein EP329_01885 [Deltaproteobacteria bacterium]|nr:MAG: hypothetical protein EP329_01885 [Deltaproteobacteria bacterium]